MLAAALVLFLMPAFALVAGPRGRRVAALALLLAGLGLAGAAVAADATATLEVTHEFAAYVGTEVQSKSWVVDRATAAGWLGPLLAAGYAVLWALAALIWRAVGCDGPFAAPLALAWSGTALLLVLQKTAAPAVLALGIGLPGVPPFEAVLLPALAAAALRLGRRSPSIASYVFSMSVLVALAHLPLAIAGTWCTRHELGTYLDVHTIDFVANPLNRNPTELAAGSNAQLTWLIWIPQLLIWPGLAMLSTGGFGFAALMASRQHAEDHAAASSAPPASLQ